MNQPMTLDGLIATSIAASSNFSSLIDRAGYQVNDEIMRIEALTREIDRRHDAVRALIAKLNEAPPTPASEAARLEAIERRAQIEQHLDENLPLILRSRVA